MAPELINETVFEYYELYFGKCPYEVKNVEDLKL